MDREDFKERMEVELKKVNRINPLDEINIILMEQLQRLRKLDITDQEVSKIEIARGNAISNTSKTILQTIGVQMLTDKQRYTVPMIEKVE